MTEHPILFTGEMVRAILAGRKTQTRRVVRLDGYDGGDLYENRDGDIDDVRCYCPYGRAGDRLWVREGFYQSPITPEVRFKADCEMRGWRPMPSIYMPRSICRLFLTVKAVRIEQVQDISEADAVAEGCVDLSDFRRLWEKINAKRGFGWRVNPWVWVVDFEREDDDA
jgi:hypothetical protein